MNQTHKEIISLVEYVFTAHEECAKKSSNKYRRHDMATPYAVHPTWCAMTILTETNLPEEIRIRGYKALLLHDILEDTTKKLPVGLSEMTVSLVKDMTFENFEEEKHYIWEKSPEVRLLKLHDKVSNLLDGTWMTPEKKLIYDDFATKLCDDVEKNYGKLNIVKIARSIIK